MTRAEVLEKAKQCVCGDREEDYGSPENSFRVIAEFWSSYLKEVDFDRNGLTPKDVAMMMALLKVARTANRHKDDNYVDLAGYAACAGELAGIQRDLKFAEEMNDALGKVVDGKTYAYRVPPKTPDYSASLGGINFVGTGNGGFNFMNMGEGVPSWSTHS